MQAKDVMTVNVVSVSEDTPVHEIVRLLLKYRISAVPVVDSARKVVGIVSEGDLLRPEGTSAGWRKGSWWLQAFFAGEALSDEKAYGRTAGAVMTRNPITVSENTPSTKSPNCWSAITSSEFQCSPTAVLWVSSVAPTCCTGSPTRSSNITNRAQRGTGNFAVN